MDTNRSKLGVLQKWPILILPLYIVAFLLIACPFATIFTLIGFYLPWIPGILIPTCVATYILLVQANKRKRRLRKVATNFLVIPLCFWFSTFFYAHISYFISKQPEMSLLFSKLYSKARFPLSHIETIAVDSHERIYCTSSDYSRLQVFDREGRFLRGWFVKIRPITYRLHVDQDDNVVVTSKSSKEKTFYSSNGKLLRSVRITDFDEEFCRKRPIQVKSDFGNTYKLYPAKISNLTPQGEETVLVKDGFNLWLLNPPRAFIFFIIFLGLFCWSRPK